MQIKPQTIHHSYWKLVVIVLSGFCYVIPMDIGVANARETVKATNPVPGSTIAQATGNQPNRRRLRTPFFEEERKLRFGFGDFLQSALDGVDNLFSADPITNLSNATLNELSSPLAGNIAGTLTVGSRDEDNPNFLTTTFEAPGVNLIFTKPSYGSDPRIGTITVDGSITVRGQTLTFNNLRNYNGSFSVKNDLVNGAIQLVDPRNPGTTILIQLPPTTIPNVNDDDAPIRAGAVLSIGLPTDR